MGAHGDNLGVTDTEPLRGHGEEQCSQLPQCFPTPNTCTREGKHVQPLPCGGHQGGRRAEPWAGGHLTPNISHSTSPNPLPGGCSGRDKG